MSHEDAKKQALKIGQYIVDIYGATIEDVVFMENGNIMIYADEHGEKFCCEFTPKEWSDYAKESGVIK